MGNCERDEELEAVIRKIPQQSQVQYSTRTQLEYLRIVANRLGLYDAVDFLKRVAIWDLYRS